MNKSLYVDIPIDLWKVIHKRAFETGISKRDLVVDALGIYLELDSEESKNQSVVIKEPLPKKEKGFTLSGTPWRSRRKMKPKVTMGKRVSLPLEKPVTVRPSKISATKLPFGEHVRIIDKKNSILFE